MGAWSAGPFDNDDAVDFMIELEDTPSWQTVSETFDTVLSQPGYVELTDGARVCAAAALITIATGKSEVSAQNYHMTLDSMGPVPPGLALKARQAVRQVSTGNSEIRELYLDSGSYAEWFETVTAIDVALGTP